MVGAVISDIHDNYHNLTLCLLQLKSYDIDRIFFLGDFMNAGIAQTLAEYPVPTFAVWGNNDGDRCAVTQVSLSPRSSLRIGMDTYDFVEFGGRSLFLTHFPRIAEPMARSGDFDAVFYGHDHKRNMRHVGECLVLNPGELSAHKTGAASFALYDSEKNQARIVDVEGGTISVLTETVKDYRKTINFDI